MALIIKRDPAKLKRTAWPAVERYLRIRSTARIRAERAEAARLLEMIGDEDPIGAMSLRSVVENGPPNA